jgi:hypothetical protein
VTVKIEIRGVTYEVSDYTAVRLSAGLRGEPVEVALDRINATLAAAGRPLIVAPDPRDEG